MTIATDLLRNAFRDYENAGIPASGPFEPNKRDIRAAFDRLSLEITGLSQGLIPFATVADLIANTTQEDGTLAYVYANNSDPADAANGIYQWDDTASEWVKAPWYFETIRSSVLGDISVANDNVRLGAGALDAYAGADAIGIGQGALAQATGIRNVGLGPFAGGAITSGVGNFFAGYGAGSGEDQLATAEYTIGIGYGVVTTAIGQVAIGDTAQDHLRMFGIELARWDSVGHNLSLAGAGRPRGSGWTGTYSLAAGEGALSSATTASSCAAFGHFAMEENQTGNGTTAVGVSAARFGTAVFDSTYVGNLAGEQALTGVGDTACGYRALQMATVARNNTALGDSAGWLTQGSRGVFAGYRCAEYVTGGDDAIYIGTAAGVNRAGGDRVLFIGTHAGGFPALTPDPVTGAGAQAAGDRVLGIGFEALKQALGNDITAVGDQAGASVTDGSDSVFLGSGSGNHGSQKVDVVNSIAIGAGTYTTAHNQVVIGNADNDNFTFGTTSFSEAELTALKALVA